MAANNRTIPQSMLDGGRPKAKLAFSPRFFP
jgi:hypothetical protein